MRQAVPVAVLLASGAAVAVTGLLGGWPIAVGGREEAVCPAVHDLVAVMDLRTVAEQSALRVRAAELADSLLTADGAAPMTPAQRHATGEAIVGLLDDPAATVPQLALVVGPVLVACDQRG